MFSKTRKKYFHFVEYEWLKLINIFNLGTISARITHHEISSVAPIISSDNIDAAQVGSISFRAPEM